VWTDQVKEPPMSLTVTMSSARPAGVTSDVESDSEVQRYLQTAVSLAKSIFDVDAVRYSVEEDPEVVDSYYVLSVPARMSVDEALKRDGEYTRRWVEAVPAHIIGRIRLTLDIMGQ
jgi:hypothetical protein